MEGGSRPRPSLGVTEAAHDRLPHAEDAVPCHGHRDAQFEGEVRAVDREGAENAHVGMRHVEPAGLETVPEQVPTAGVDRQPERHPGAEAVDGDSVDHLAGALHRAVGAVGRGEHLDVVAGVDESTGEVAHLRLDPPDPGWVAVGDESNLHAVQRRMGEDGR